MTEGPISRFPAWVVVGLIQSHYEKDDEKFESWTKEIENFLNKDGREEVADYVRCVRTGTGLVPTEEV